MFRALCLSFYLLVLVVGKGSIMYLLKWIVEVIGVGSGSVSLA